MLDPRILAAVGDLELVARVTVEGSVAGLHRSPFHGYSAEFSQYRHYRPGDDLKYVDWKLFARTDRIYTRQYRETTNMVGQVAIDASASMAYAGGTGVSKIAYARLLAAALTYLISTQGDAVGLLAYDETIRHYVPSRSGPSHLRRLLVTLAGLEASGRTVTGAALKRAVDLLTRRGLLIIISDLYDEDETIERELRRAVRMGHELAVFHVLSAEEIDFTFPEETEFEDLETGRRLLASPAAMGAAYRRDMALFLERWRARCAMQGIEYVRVRTDMPLDAALRGYLLKRRRGVSR